MPLRLSRCYMVTVFSRFQKSFAPEKPGKQFHSGYRLRTLRSNGRQDGSLRCSILDATSATISKFQSSVLGVAGESKTRISRQLEWLRSIVIHNVSKMVATPRHTIPQHKKSEIISLHMVISNRKG
ncbi:hypothetical protein BDFG_04695 [Blastomyces dermatitidis ATCC 26199]|nr:hypothetical protein BDFG_04695 [Blastomyces dermatitidis ATCC 26199]